MIEYTNDELYRNITTDCSLLKRIKTSRKIFGELLNNLKVQSLADRVIRSCNRPPQGFYQILVECNINTRGAPTK